MEYVNVLTTLDLVIFKTLYFHWSHKIFVAIHVFYFYCIFTVGGGGEFQLGNAFEFV